MVKTQVQIPDDLFQQAKRVAARKEWSFAEIVRRGLEQMVICYPEEGATVGRKWRLPDPVNLGLKEDPLVDPDWREKANLGSSAARLIAEQLREQAAHYEEKT